MLRTLLYAHACHARIHPMPSQLSIVTVQGSTHVKHADRDLHMDSCDICGLIEYEQLASSVSLTLTCFEARKMAKDAR